MMSIISTILVGLVVGLLARAIKPGDDKLSLVWTIILGVLGSLLAGWFGRQMGWYMEGEPAGWIASIIGAIVLLLAYGLLRKKAG